MTHDGLLHLFVRGVDKNIWYKPQQVARATPTRRATSASRLSLRFRQVVNDSIVFGSWRTLGGNSRSFAC